MAGGFFKDLVVPFNDLTRDNNVRADTSLEKLASLKTAFDPSPAGTLTAGNSSPLTDGAAAVLLSSEDWASSRKFLCRLTSRSPKPRPWTSSAWRARRRAC